MTATARLSLRLNTDDKARVIRAADLRGVPVSAFVRAAAMRKVESAMVAETTVALSADASRRLINGMDVPFRPNAKLKRALARVASV